MAWRLFRPVLVIAALAATACPDARDRSAKGESSRPAAAESPALAGQVAEIENYQLTVDDLRKYVQAGINLEQVGRDHPELEPLTHVRIDEFDQLEAKIRGNPHLLNAVQDAGLSPRQYSVISWVVLNVTLASFMPDSEAAAMLEQAHVHPANLTFFKENEAQLEALNLRR